MGGEKRRREGEAGRRRRVYEVIYCLRFICFEVVITQYIKTRTFCHLVESCLSVCLFVYHEDVSNTCLLSSVYLSRL